MGSKCGVVDDGQHLVFSSLFHVLYSCLESYVVVFFYWMDSYLVLSY